MIVFLFTILSAVYDNTKRFISHLLKYLLRFCFVVVVSYFEDEEFFLNFALNSSIFYITFDYVLNLFEGRKWNYIGNTANHDKFWRKYGGWKYQLAFKVTFFLLTLTLKHLL